MNTKHMRLLLSAASASALAACTSTAPHLDWNFGYATTTLIQQQTLNPEAGKSTDPVQGLDGQAAVNVMGGYQRSFTGSAGGSPGAGSNTRSTGTAGSVGLGTQ